MLNYSFKVNIFFASELPAQGPNYDSGPEFRFGSTRSFSLRSRGLVYGLE